MKVGIIGTGDVGRALAEGSAGTNHDVLMGSRTPDTTTVEDRRVDTQQVAAEFGDVVILALPVDIVTDVAADVRSALAGKPVVDTTNEYPNEGPGPSVAQRVADVAPAAQVIKGFNTIGANRMADPLVGNDPATMFLAGDEGAAVETVAELAADIGFCTETGRGPLGGGAPGTSRSLLDRPESDSRSGYRLSVARRGARYGLSQPCCDPNAPKLGLRRRVACIATTGRRTRKTSRYHRLRRGGSRQGSRSSRSLHRGRP